MRAWHWIALAICSAMTGFVAWQSLQMTPQTEAALQPAPITTEPVPAAVEEMREQTKELAKLRNEVMQLRAAKRELELARQENAQLLGAQTVSAPVPRQAPPGFIGKEQLANSGFATPDHAMQTFFWALREGNFRMMFQAISPSDPERQRIDKMSPEQVAKLESKAALIPAQQMRNFTDFGIRWRETISDEAVVLHVGSSLSTNTMPFRFERTAEGWKLRAPFSP